MTSLSMPGFSLTLLLLPRDSEKGEYSSKQILEYLDAPASAPGWAFNSVTEPGVHTKDEAPVTAAAENVKEVDLAREYFSLVRCPV
jgi:dihydroxyacetone kinase